MSRRQRLEAKAIERILDAETGKVVGWLYEWDTGERIPRWKDGPVENVIYEQDADRPNPSIAGKKLALE